LCVAKRVWEGTRSEDPPLQPRGRAGGGREKQIPHYVRDDTERKWHSGEGKSAGLKPHTYKGSEKDEGVMRTNRRGKPRHYNDWRGQRRARNT
jgi:hypothetical protein